MDYQATSAETASATPSLTDILISFLKLGATSFGGGTAAWTHREVVERRGWMDEENFLQALTVAQAMPGANPVNLAVFVGMQLRGAAGATLAAFGMIAPAFLIILVLAALYKQFSDYPQAAAILTGLACVGIASTVTMGIKTGRRLKGKWVLIAIALAVFVAVALLRWPLVAVVLAMTPVSVAACYFMDRKPKHG